MSFFEEIIGADMTIEILTNVWYCGPNLAFVCKYFSENIKRIRCDFCILSREGGCKHPAVVKLGAAALKSGKIPRLAAFLTWIMPDKTRVDSICRPGSNAMAAAFIEIGRMIYINDFLERNPAVIDVIKSSRDTGRNIINFCILNIDLVNLELRRLFYNQENYTLKDVIKDNYINVDKRILLYIFGLRKAAKYALANGGWFAYSNEGSLVYMLYLAVWNGDCHAAEMIYEEIFTTANMKEVAAKIMFILNERGITANKLLELTRHFVLENFDMLEVSNKFINTLGPVIFERNTVKISFKGGVLAAALEYFRGEVH